MNDIVAGSVVRLKSSGPEMTVKYVDGDEAYCEWFAKDDVKGAMFALVQLERMTGYP